MSVGITKRMETVATYCVDGALERCCFTADATEPDWPEVMQTGESRLLLEFTTSSPWGADPV